MYRPQGKRLGCISRLGRKTLIEGFFESLLPLGAILRGVFACRPLEIFNVAADKIHKFFLVLITEPVDLHQAGDEGALRRRGSVPFKEIHADAQSAGDAVQGGQAGHPLSPLYFAKEVVGNPGLFRQPFNGQKLAFSLPPDVFSD